MSSISSLSICSSFLNKCSEWVQVDSPYNFSSPNFGKSNYPNNLHQEITFTASGQLKLLLSLHYIRTEEGYDYLTIGDGAVTNQNALLTYSGGPVTNGLRVLSNNCSLWLTFITDYSVTDAGFWGTVEPVNETYTGISSHHEFSETTNLVSTTCLTSTTEA